ncbi:MAG: glycosyltransferase, partial [Vulcanimicrobiaceae bacterium]
MRDGSVRTGLPSAASQRDGRMMALRGLRPRSVSVIIPAFNESKHIANNLLEVVDVFNGLGRDFEVIVVDDGSSDNTDLRVARVAMRHPELIRIIRYESNEGKGNALVRGTREACGEYAIFLDADLDLHPSQLPAFFAIMESRGVDAVVGSKWHPLSRVAYPTLRRLYSRCYYAVVRALFGLPIRDSQTGLKLYRMTLLRDILPRLLVKRFAFDLEVLAVAHFRGYKIVDAPVVLEFKRSLNRLKPNDVWRVIIDTIAIFYRLRVLRYYAGTGVPERSQHAESTKARGRLKNVAAHDRPSLKIAFVIDTCAPFYVGGYETRAWALARELAKSHDVHVFTSLDRSCNLEGVHFHRVRGRVGYFRADGFRDLLQSVWFALSILRCLGRSGSFDVVDCNATPFVHIFPARLLAAWWGAAFIITAHEALSDVVVPYFRARRVWAPRLTGSACRGIYLLAQRLSRAVITPTRRMADELRREGCKQVFAVPAGVAPVGDAKRYRELALDREMRVCYYGRVARNKRPEKVLSAFCLAVQRGFRGRLVIAGTGSEIPALRRMSRKLGIEALTDFVGFIHESDRFHFLAKDVDVFISASYREGFCLSALEAMAAGNPAILASKPERFASGALDFAEDGCNAVVTDGEARSLCDALILLQRDSAMYDRLSANGVETARRYSWE